MKIAKLFALLFSMLMLLCCNDKNEKRMFDEWMGRKIIIPDELVGYSINGCEDSVMYKFRQMKIVMYVDSNECIGCKLDLSKWSEFIDEVGRKSSVPVSFYIVFHPLLMSELTYVLRRDKFEHMVYIDENDVFNLLNQFPSDDRFRCFLLDSCDNVTLLGNPIHNDAIRQLYIKAISDGM